MQTHSYKRPYQVDKTEKEKSSEDGDQSKQQQYFIY